MSIPFVLDEDDEAVAAWIRYCIAHGLLRPARPSSNTTPMTSDHAASERGVEES